MFPLLSMFSGPTVISGLAQVTDQAGILISPLRIAGIVLGSAFFSFVMWQASKGSGSRFNVFAGTLLALALVLISVFPGIATLTFQPFSLSNGEGFPRLVGLLVAAVLFLTFTQFILASRIGESRRELSTLVSTMAINRYLAEIGPRPAPNVLVVIPAYNEEESLADVLSKVPDKINDVNVEVVVVVDGATDTTESVARDFGIPAIHATNRGQTAALVTGYGIAKRRGANIVATIDADGQMVPAELENVIAPITAGIADLVTGSRILGSFHADNRVRALGVLVFGLLLTLLVRQRITDPSIGMRAIRVASLQRMRFREDRFGAAELLVEAHRRGLRIQEVPVTILPRSAGETRKPTSLRYGFNFARAMIQSWLR